MNYMYIIMIFLFSCGTFNNTTFMNNRSRPTKPPLRNNNSLNTLNPVLLHVQNLPPTLNTAQALTNNNSLNTLNPVLPHVQNLPPTLNTAQALINNNSIKNPTPPLLSIPNNQQSQIQISSNPILTSGVYNTYHANQNQWSSFPQNNIIIPTPLYYDCNQLNNNQQLDEKISKISNCTWENKNDIGCNSWDIHNIKEDVEYMYKLTKDHSTQMNELHNIINELKKNNLELKNNNEILLKENDYHKKKSNKKDEYALNATLSDFSSIDSESEIQKLNIEQSSILDKKANENKIDCLEDSESEIQKLNIEQSSNLDKKPNENKIDCLEDSENESDNSDCDIIDLQNITIKDDLQLNTKIVKQNKNDQKKKQKKKNNNNKKKKRSKSVSIKKYKPKPKPKHKHKTITKRPASRKGSKLNDHKKKKKKKSKNNNLNWGASDNKESNLKEEFLSLEIYKKLNLIIKNFAEQMENNKKKKSYIEIETIDQYQQAINFSSNYHNFLVNHSKYKEMAHKHWGEPLLKLIVFSFSEITDQTLLNNNNKNKKLDKLSPQCLSLIDGLKCIQKEKLLTKGCINRCKLAIEYNIKLDKACFGSNIFEYL